ncbi:glycosyltransferase [Gordonia hongkongensis]|uniref:glycosyltransferase n=1 Tax=Gordonia hongkongensis TaxID=1701090 RepID=UPI001FF7DFB8|nr:glycosyltransferase [Gordonia hongkongensis]UPG69219.1 glycosyltransferase [Gordonia hongkongensis]
MGRPIDQRSLTARGPEQLSGVRVVYVAAEHRAGGVGAYAQVFADMVRSRVADFHEVRHPQPGSDSIGDLRARRREIAAIIDDAGARPVVVHCELSGGSVESFWPTAGLERRRPSVLVSATVHDPPGLVWWPGRVATLAQRRVLNHAIHFPLRPLSRGIERRVTGSRTLFAMSDVGARSLLRAYPDADVRHAYMPVWTRGEVVPAPDRPRAIGLFGLVYRGKGFEHVTRLRRALPEDIAIRIAGRGTEDLPAVDGVDILGGLDDADLPDFFSSIRALVVPYGARSPYGEAFPGSSVVNDAIAHLTPVVCTGHGALAELRSEGGAVVVDEEGCTPEVLVEELAAAATALVGSPDRLSVMVNALRRMREVRQPDAVVDTYLTTWSGVLCRR